MGIQGNPSLINSLSWDFGTLRQCGTPRTCPGTSHPHSEGNNYNNYKNYNNSNNSNNYPVSFRLGSSSPISPLFSAAPAEFCRDSGRGFVQRDFLLQPSRILLDFPSKPRWNPSSAAGSILEALMSIPFQDLGGSWQAHLPVLLIQGISRSSWNSLWKAVCALLTAAGLLCPC